MDETADSTPAGTSSRGPATDGVLDLVWRRHRQWSVLADAAKSRLDRWRLSNLLMLVAGALAGAVAAQTWLAAGGSTAFALTAAVALAVAGFIQKNFLGPERTVSWTGARAASEALKAEVFRYLTRVTPYDSPDRAQVLQAQFEVVQGRVSEQLRTDAQAMQADNKAVPSIGTFAQYVSDRAQNQAEWHRNKIAEHVRQAKALRRWQLLATGLGVVLSAVAGVLPAWHLTTWTAAATTIAAALGAHLAATGHQRIAAGYARTADQLDRVIAGISPENSSPDERARFVADVERVLAAQNEGWTDLLSSRSTTPEESRPPGDG